MTLVSSGILSIGGSTTNRSINLELSLSATANSNLNQTNFRSLAGIATGSISISNFYGKSSSPTNTQISVKFTGDRGANCSTVCEQEGFDNTVYTPGNLSNFLTQTNLYQNSAGTLNASGGWYSNGTNCRQWNGNTWTSALGNC